MGAKISRRKLADYGARELMAGNPSVLDQIAAYLVQSRRTREVELVVRDIEGALESRGVLRAHATSAHALSDDVRQQIETFLARTTDATRVILSETVESAVLGGIKVQTPTAVYDTTIQHNISALRALKQ